MARVFQASSDIAESRAWQASLLGCSEAFSVQRDGSRGGISCWHNANGLRTSSVSINSETAGCSASTYDADQPLCLRPKRMDPDLIDDRVSRNHQSATAPAFACLLTKSCRTGISCVETSRAGTDLLQRVQCHQRKNEDTVVDRTLQGSERGAVNFNAIDRPLSASDA